jgi:hypothetical protein
VAPTHDDPKRSRSLNIGSSVNTLRGPRARTRTGFWNVQNFTTDLVQQGKIRVSEKIDSGRNQIRMDFIADTIVGLDFESLVVMEMGSDAERFLAALVERLNARMPEKERTWGSDISVDNGKVVEPPSAPFIADLTTWGSVSDRTWALVSALDYYTITGAVSQALTPRAHLDAHLRFAEARGAVLAWTSLLGYGDDDEHFVLSHENIQAALTRDRAAPHFALYDLCMGILAPAAATADDRLACIHYLVASRSRITLAPTPGRNITTDGPLHALRLLGVLAGRYEKYGIVRRRHSEIFLFHSLVDTPLQAIGRPTNSRAAWEVNIPLDHVYFPAFFIHSMWTPAEAEDEDDELVDESAKELRVATLVAQAEAAKKRMMKPVFIAGDTNVDGKHVAALGKGMGAQGYTRLGKLTKTTLRTEKTLRTAPPGDVELLLSEPYDAVYSSDDLADTFDCNVAYPDWTDDVLIAAYLHQMINNPAVQQWYVELLATAFGPIAFRARPRRGVSDPVTDAATKALASFPDEPKTLGDYIARMTALRKAVIPKGGKDALTTFIATFLELDALSPRTFLLFHRVFISDHRVVLIDVATTGYLGSPYAPRKGTSSADFSGSTAKAGPLGPLPVDDGAAHLLTPGGGARVACLAQTQNTCGVRAAYNCLWFAALRDGTHAQLWAFAPPLAPVGQVFNVNHAIDITEDQVEAVLAAAGQAATIPVVGQFLYLDAMGANILPRNVGMTRIIAYQGEVATFRAPPLPVGPMGLPPPPPPAPVLRFVLHTGAQQQVHRQVGVGHYFAVEVTATALGYTFRYADSLVGAGDRSDLIRAFIARYLP